MDPITMMLLAQGVAGLGKAGYGAWQKRQGKKALASAYEAPTGKPSEYADLIQQARASEISKRRLDEINKTMATSTAALQQAGSRGVIGGIGAVTAAGAGAKTQALSQQQAEIMRALERSTIGAEYQRQRDVNRQIREENLAMSAIQAGQENIIGGVGDIMKAGLAYGQGVSEGIIDKPSGLFARKSNTGLGDAVKSATPELSAQGQSALDMSTKFRTDYIKSLSKKKPSVNILSESVNDTTGVNLLDEVTVTAENGAKIKKTPGKFSHKSNPIDIMKDGAKIGEMTGGEYIFNPSQAKSLQKLAKSGNSDLHKFVRSLLNKPQFK